MSSVVRRPSSVVRRPSSVVVSSLCSALGASAASLGQAIPDPSVIGVDPRMHCWHSHDLGILASRSATALTDQYTATGISENGVVVGKVVGGGTIEPWVWFPCESVSFGFPARQMISLRPPSGDLVAAEAFGVNSTGIIVGSADASGGGTWPVYWSLSGSPPTITMVQLGNQQGEAYAVNDATGGNGWDIVLATDGGSCAWTAFRYRQGDPPTTLRTLSPHSGDGAAYPLDVSTPLPGQQPIAVGHAEDPCAGFCPGVMGVDAVRWTLPAVHPPNPIPETFREDFSTNPADPQPLDLWRAEAEGVNSQRQSVGWYEAAATNCLVSRAVFWRFNRLAIDLGGAPPALGAESSTRAFAISNSETAGAVSIVGSEIIADLGVVWWRPSTPAAPGTAAFSAVTINMLPAAILPGLQSVRELVDINANGWMIGNGERVPGQEKRAYLLRPNWCPLDLSGDLTVGADDQALLLGAWSAPGTTCAGCCPADLDRDGVVGSSDLAILLGAWGTTCTQCTGSGGIAGSNAATASAGGWIVTDESVGEALALFGYSEVSGFAAWLSELDSEAQNAALTAFNTALLQYSVIHGGGA